jgi:hypothetical protein
MSRFSVGLLLLLSLAATAASAQQRKAIARKSSESLINLSYWNWAEAMKVTDGTTTIEAPSNFAGIGLEYEVVPAAKNYGWAYAAAFITGTATGGTKTGPPIYFASYQKFNALAFKLNRFTRLYQRVYLEFGPLVMARSFAWPNDGNLTATSGSQFNFGASLNLRMRLAPRTDFCQSVGTLMTNASTVWSLGFGYRF